MTRNFCIHSTLTDMMSRGICDIGKNKIIYSISNSALVTKSNLCIEYSGTNCKIKLSA